MANHWNSPHAIWRDLSVAQGRAVPAQIEHTLALDERPPRLAVPEDAENEVQLRRLGGVQPPTNAPDAPDLAGITKMLRMVQEVDTMGQEHNVLTISKLNPEVAEFIPRSMTADETAKFNLNGGRIDTDRLTPDEKEVIKEQLKSKISDTSNATCAKVKRERNLAIATLVKLHCIPKAPPLVCSAVEKGTKLKSPAYYEEPPKPTEKVCATERLDNKRKIKIIAEQPSNRKDETETSNMLNVQKWLDESNNSENNAGKKMAKHNSLYLGEVTFKRKAPNKPMSPSSTESSVNVRSIEDTVFKPTKFSEELTLKYRERCKANERVEQNMWTKLESDLKAQDEVIKNREKKQPESS